jgi:hypothetical protein
MSESGEESRVRIAADSHVKGIVVKEAKKHGQVPEHRSILEGILWSFRFGIEVTPHLIIINPRGRVP